MGGTMHAVAAEAFWASRPWSMEKSWTEIHKSSGFSGPAGFGVGLNNRLEAVGNAEFGSYVLELRRGTSGRDCGVRRGRRRAIQGSDI
jgi:hypothetical protein